MIQRGGNEITQKRKKKKEKKWHWKQIDYSQRALSQISMAVNFSVKQKAFLLGLNAAICEEDKCNVGKVLMSLRGTHDPTVRCQNAKGLIDSLVLNCMFELISTLRPSYVADPQPLLYC